MALLADDDFGAAMDLVHLGLPVQMFFGAGAGLFVFQVILLAEYEHDDVGVLLDGPRFAKIGELRAFVVALFDLTRELREGNDGNGEFLGEGFEAGGDLGEFLNAVFPFFGGAGEQLKVIDDENVQPLLAFQTAGACRQLGD